MYNNIQYFCLSEWNQFEIHDFLWKNLSLQILIFDKERTVFHQTCKNVSTNLKKKLIFGWQASGKRKNKQTQRKKTDVYYWITHHRSLSSRKLITLSMKRKKKLETWESILQKRISRFKYAISFHGIWFYVWL